MNIFTIFFTAFLVGLSGAVMPGPLLSVSIYGGLNRGIKGGLAPVVGHSIVEAVTIILLLVGLKQFLAYAMVQGVIGMAGGVALIFMGIGMLRTSKELKLETSVMQFSRAGIFQGIIATLSNPYWYIWWATIGLNYISISMEKGVYGLPVFYFGHILSDFVWCGLVAYLVGRGVKKFSPKVYTSIIFALALFLVFLGISFIVFGISKIGA